MPSETSAAVPVVAPAGDLDLANARELGTELAELAGTPGDAVLDLTQIAFMDSVGLGVVLKAVERYRRQGKQLVLVVPPEGTIARLLQFAGVSSRVAAHDTRDAALAHVARER